MKYILVIWMVILPIAIFSQSDFDKSLKVICQDLTTKLIQKNKSKLVVLYVTDINKSSTVTGKYLADIISVNIVNSEGNFHVFDRENLGSIHEAKKLMAEGYITVEDAKILGRLLSVDVIVIGNYTVLSNTLKLTLKALDSSTGFVVAASISDLPFDEDARVLLGVGTNSTNGHYENNSNRGFYRPLNSNEQINNPETVSKDCAIKNIGDYCFENLTTYKLRVNVGTTDYGRGEELLLNPGQTLCYYNMSSKKFYFSIYRGIKNNDGSYNFYSSDGVIQKGNILVEQCKSKTYIIK